MSYCRWSSDNWNCDVYVYESDEGWVIHVANNHRIADTPCPALPDILTTSSEDWQKAYQEQCEWVETSICQPIGLPEDGKTFIEESPANCANRLIELKNTGYVVPQHVIDTLLDEPRHTVGIQTRYGATSCVLAAF